MKLLALGVLLGCSLNVFGEPAPLKPLPQVEPSPFDTAVPDDVVTEELRLVGIEPAFGSTAGGSTVTLTGDFPEGVIVNFGPAVAPKIDASSTTVTVETPPSAAGPVTVRVSRDQRFSLLDGAFTYYPDRANRTGLAGVIDRQSLVGGYWPPDLVSDGGARLAFVDLNTWSYADEYGTPGACTHEFTPTLPPGTDLGVATLSMTSTLGGKHVLEPLETAGWFGGDLLDTEIEPGTRFTLEPLLGASTIPAFPIPDLATLPGAFSVVEPAFDAAIEPPLSQTFTLQWDGQGGDFMVLELVRLFDPGDGSLLVDDAARCTFPDTGTFTVDGAVWPEWYVNDTMFVRLGRVVQSDTVLLHDNAAIRVAAVQFVVGLAITVP